MEQRERNSWAMSTRCQQICNIVGDFTSWHPAGEHTALQAAIYRCLSRKVSNVATAQSLKRSDSCHMAAGHKQTSRQQFESNVVFVSYIFQWYFYNRSCLQVRGGEAWRWRHVVTVQNISNFCCSTFEEVCRRIYGVYVCISLSLYVYLYSICMLCLCNTLCFYTLTFVECAHIDAGCFRFIRVSWIATQSLSSEPADHLQAAAAALAIALADPIFQIALDHGIQPVF